MPPVYIQEAFFYLFLAKKAAYKGKICGKFGKKCIYQDNCVLQPRVDYLNYITSKYGFQYVIIKHTQRWLGAFFARADYIYRFIRFINQLYSEPKYGCATDTRQIKLSKLRKKRANLPAQKKQIPIILESAFLFLGLRLQRAESVF